MENKYINAVLSLIENKKAREDISAELESHILDKADYYTEIGYDREKALELATEEMGEPEEAAVLLNSLHKGKWYKNVWNITTLVFVFAIFLLCTNAIPIENRFRYGDFCFSTAHSVVFDFLSMFICAGYLFLMHKAFRNKSVFISVSLLFSLVFMILCDIPDFMGKMPFQFSLFHPMLYSVMSIAHQGMSGYIDSIFGYGYIPDSQKFFLACMSCALFVILLIISVFLLVESIRRHRMKNKKYLQKILKVAEIILCIFFTLNFAVAAVATTSALMNIDKKLDEMLLTKEADIKYVINADLSNGVEPCIEELTNIGYQQYFEDYNIWQGGMNSLYYGNDYNMIVAPPYEFDENDILPYWTISYCNTAIDANSPLLSNSSFLSESEYLQIEKNMSLDEFMSLGFYQKAWQVRHSYNGYDEKITFTFIMEYCGHSVTANFTKTESGYVITG